MIRAWLRDPRAVLKMDDRLGGTAVTTL